MKIITEKQREIYDYLLERTQDGVPPSVREICSAVNLSSTSSVQANLASLETAGLISRDPMHKRSIRIKVKPENPFEKIGQVPLVGTVAAGIPILAEENIESYLPYPYLNPGYISRDKPLFALHVKGDSMLDAGILDGDIVYVEKTPVASNGEIVVALLENEATVKRFYKEKGHIRLQPENDDFEPIICNEVIIMGKVVAVLRYY